MLLRQLPVPRPNELVLFYDVPSSGPLFSGLFCRFGTAVNIGVGGNTERVPAEFVSGTYFRVLGVGASLGRVLTPDDDRVRAGHPVAVLSHEYWQNRFAGDPGIVGRSITINMLWLVGAGLVFGLIAAWAASRLIQSQLYGITPSDPMTIAAAMLTLAVVALLAGYIPARRATRVNSVLALRYE